MSKESRYCLGVDIGSVSTKAALVSEGRLIGYELTASGGNYRDTAQMIRDRILGRAGLNPERLAGIVVTGLGNDSLPFPARQVSDISCLAMGCHRLFPSAHTAIDIGGQFTKVVKITLGGKISDFLISEKCATGSGRFLKVIARILQVRLEDIGPLSLQSRQPVEFSTNCAVFAESETVSRIAEGARAEDILAGVHRAMAAKVAVLVKRVKMEPDVVLTGGGGEDIGLVRAVSEALGLKLLVPELPRLSAAYGAACLAEM